MFFPSKPFYPYRFGTNNSSTSSISHRDYYDKGARITIELFDDRVEISNPGGLTSAISPSEFGTKSHSRNPLVFGLFVRINLVEQIGSGIERMRDEMNNAALPKPEFKVDGMFTAIFNRMKSSGKSSGKGSGKSSEPDWVELKIIIQQRSAKKLSKSALKILEMVFTSSEVTIPEMAKKMGITERAIEKNIQKLKGLELLERKEGNRGGYWQLKID
ncbi:ATP-binding protein [Belliella marina]|uniref:ATP-binding protein n=1 Tax=Belliella marina TaxID=1644146 RepID=A0ABW4VHB1_9BACT